MRVIPFYILTCFYLFPCILLAQNSFPSTGKPFRGSFGITAGYSDLNIHGFQTWLSNYSHDSIQVSASDFLNIGLEGFIVRNHLVLGVSYQLEGPIYFGSQSGKATPKHDKIGAMVGVDAMNEDDNKHVIFAIGLGYGETNIKFHGNPPALFQTSGIPDQIAKLKQSSFYVNPKVLFIYVTSIKLGVEAGATFYIPGRYSYGYDYTYYTYGYYNGHYGSQSHTQFIGYPIPDGVVPNFNTSLSISAFIGL